jgi:hypothetical protein
MHRTVTLLSRVAPPVGVPRTLARVLAIALVAAGAAAARAQEAPLAVSPDSAREARVRVDLPLVDAPYNALHGGRAPSMRQSLALTTGFYETAHAGIGRALGAHGRLAKGGVVLFDVLATLELPLPASDGWLHEEYHRAVLGYRGIGSFDDVYRFRFDADAIAVSHVRDEDLARLKRDHPAEQVRVGEAGIEGEYQLVQELQKHQFFGRAPGWHLPLYWLTKLGSAFYVYSGHLDETNVDTDEFNRQDGADVPRRDFTGHDFTGWVYDLHRPNEPYAARGVHPSGVGVDRYIKPADLTPEELRHLRREGRLELLNFLDPHLIGVRGVTVWRGAGGEPLRLNASAGHLLTPFGHTVDANLFLARGGTNLFVVLHAYANGARVFPGADAELVDRAVELLGRRVELSPRVALWAQPAGQRFLTSAARAGGLAALRVRAPLGGSSRLGVVAELEGKTAGWVAGVVQLGPAVNARAGVSASLF